MPALLSGSTCREAFASPSGLLVLGGPRLLSVMPPYSKHACRLCPYRGFGPAAAMSKAMLVYLQLPLLWALWTRIGAAVLDMRDIGVTAVD